MWDVRYRPKKFSEVLGQPGSVLLLKSRLRNGTAFDTNYIFAGGHGTGKTTLARIHARAMLCLALDKNDPEPCNECDNCQIAILEQPGAFVERDAASQGTIQHIRALVDDLPFAVFNAPKRIYLFDEAHRMGDGAQDVLLKPLEEKRMVGMFCTTEPKNIRGPIRSRCEDYTIRKVAREEVLLRMRLVLETEGVKFEEDAVLIVIDYCAGHVRDVLNKLEMIAQMGDVTVGTVREYLSLSVVSTYYEILLSLSDTKRALALVEQACEQVSPEDVAAGISEAAMNSYRIANGMLADFVYADRELGKRVYTMYQNHVIRFADWFQRFKYTTRIALLRDVLVFGQTTGNLPPEGAQPPVVFASPPVAGSTPPPAQVAPDVPTLAKFATPPPPVVVAAAPTVSETPRHLTTLDGKIGVDTRPPPRMRGRNEQFLVFHERGGGEDDKKTLKPEEWRLLFEQDWPWRMARG